MEPEGDQRRGDLQRLLAVVRLRDQQVVHVHAQLAGVDRIERVLHVDERRHAARLLGLGDHLQRDRGLAGRLRAEDLVDAAARKPPTPSAASSEIEPVEITATGTMASFDPSRRIEPLPNCFSICEGHFQHSGAFFLIHVGKSPGVEIRLYQAAFTADGDDKPYFFRGGGGLSSWGGAPLAWKNPLSSVRSPATTF